MSLLPYPTTIVKPKFMKSLFKLGIENLNKKMEETMKRTKVVLLVLSILLCSGITFADTINVPGDQPTIQAGIDASVDGDIVLVQPGTYVENINFAGKAVILGSLFYTTQDISYISQTIIDGNQDGSVVTFESEEDSISILSGFTITNGQGGGSYPDWTGGGITCINYSSPSLENVTITGNSAGYGGGIICINNSSPSLENVTITNNSAGSGGGIYCTSSSSPSLQNVTITDNSADEFGGGIICYSSSPNLENVTITDNSAYYGGGINCSSSSPSLENVTITNNSAGQSGGGITCRNSSSPILVNVTITGNSANNWGGGIYCYSSSNLILVNCISWNNSPQEVLFANNDDPNTITIAYSDIDGGEEGIETNNNGTVNWLEGNIDADPLFVDAGMGDYRLSEDSPCIDTGIAYFEYDGDVLVDLSEDEYYGAAPDMGVYEYGMVATDEFEIENVESKISNYPNPFNPITTINYSLKENSKVSINIYNIKGQNVKQLVNDQLSEGEHSVVWDGKADNGKSVSSGIYFYKLIVTGKTEAVKKCILMK